MNIQDLFLNQLRKEKINVVLEMLDGKKIVGVIKGFDNFCIMLQTQLELVLVYKHALSKIIPPKEFILKPGEKDYKKQ
ncbi:MAG: RNA chaperone Hfq [Proteobacteria bacterium]|nr:RNA chaperone Hfq [Pseudomonadota bacterium]